MRVIKCSGIAQAYEKGVRYVLGCGAMKHIHGTDVLQADPCVLEIRIDNDNDHSNLAPLKQGASGVYRDEFLNPDKGDQPYTYGERLLAYSYDVPNIYGGDEIKINQLDYIVQTLIDESTSRQAVAIIWNPLKDEEMKEPPCFQYTQAFENSEGDLELMFVFRSNAWDMALQNNLQGLKVFTNEIARRVNKPCYKINLLAVCPHIYWYNIDDIKSKLGL